MKKAVRVNEWCITHLFDELVFRSLRVQLLSGLDYDGELVLYSLVLCRRGVEAILEFLYRESIRHGQIELEWLMVVVWQEEEEIMIWTRIEVDGKHT